MTSPGSSGFTSEAPIASGAGDGGRERTLEWCVPHFYSLSPILSPQHKPSAADIWTFHPAKLGQGEFCSEPVKPFSRFKFSLRAPAVGKHRIFNSLNHFFFRVWLVLIVPFQRGWVNT